MMARGDHCGYLGQYLASLAWSYQIIIQKNNIALAMKKLSVFLLLKAWIVIKNAFTEAW